MRAVGEILDVAVVLCSVVVSVFCSLIGVESRVISAVVNTFNVDFVCGIDTVDVKCGIVSRVLVVFCLVSSTVFKRVNIDTTLSVVCRGSETVDVAAELSGVDALFETFVLTYPIIFVDISL